MATNGARGRVTASDAAREAIARLRAEWGPVMFVQPASCCGDTTPPLCYPAADLPTDDNGLDLSLGEVAGCAFLIDGALYRQWHEPDLVLDVEPGDTEGFSLPAGPGSRFVTRPAGDGGACGAA